MKRYIKAFASLLAGLMLVSCAQDNLDFGQHGVIPVDETYANADDATADQFIANIYVQVKYLTMGDWGVNYLMTPAVKAGEIWPGGSSTTDGPDYQKMATMIDDSEVGAYKDMYQRFYRIIYRANMIVEKLNDQSDHRKRVIGEAKAWRAWSMMRLTQLWGTAPLVTHTLDGINYSFTPGNADPKESWKWIMQQFDEAAVALPSKSGLGGQKAIGGRWTAEACYAYKAQGYMWQNDYANAKVELAKVINSGKYDLWNKTTTMGPKNYGANMKLYKDKNNDGTKVFVDGSEQYEYLTLYRAEADFCDEFLLELDIDGDAITITDTEPYWFRAYMNWRTDKMYVPGNMMRDEGWGFVNPTATFGKALCKHDGNGIRRRALVATYDEVYRMFPYADASVQGIMEGQRVFGCEGYFRMKYYDFLDDLHEGRYAAGNSQGNMTNFPLMRYADVLLMYAEAVCMTGEGTANITGLEALNKVRRRAGLTDAPKLDMENETYGIKAERRFELFLDDCNRYADLIRWGDYKDHVLDLTDSGVGPAWGTSCPTLLGFKDAGKTTEDPADLSNYNVTYEKFEGTTRGTWSDKMYLFPFPSAEMTQNPNLNQNTGW